MDVKMVVAAKTLDHSLRRRDNRRAELLDAAAQNFRLRGYAAVSMREIAFDARMKAGSMYYYFPSKVELLIAVHEEGVKRIRRAVETAIEAVKKAGEGGDVDALTEAVEQLTAAQHKAAEQLYQQAETDKTPSESEGDVPSDPSSDGATSRESGDVIDAEVVEDDKG